MRNGWVRLVAMAVTLLSGVLSAAAQETVSVGGTNVVLIKPRCDPWQRDPDAGR